MNRIIARFLLWFFIAALPVQGIAAAMRSCCAPARATQAGPGLHIAGAAEKQVGNGAGRADHAGQAGQAEHAGHAGMPRGEHCAAMAEPVHAGCDTAQSAKHDAGACSACAACCFAAPPTMPSSIVFAALAFSSIKIALAPMPIMAGHILSGLERPPRLFLV